MSNNSRSGHTPSKAEGIFWLIVLLLILGKCSSCAGCAIITYVI